MKSNLVKETLREIWKSRNRFFSILGIVALGVAFFVGVKVSCPDMKLTMEHYYEDTNLADMHLASTYGFNENDLKAIEAEAGIRGIMPAYSVDAFVDTGSRADTIVKVLSYDTKAQRDTNNDINRPVLKEGRMPENPGECVVEKNIHSPKEFEIGNQISLLPGKKDDDISDTLTVDKFTIVGIVESSSFISFDRGKTQIGDGEIDTFMFIPVSYTHLSLTFDDVDFRYLGSEQKTLSGISFTVHGGQTLALIGATGDGKSSLVSLISRMYDVEKGHVRLNGADVRELSQKTLHDKVSFVPQTSTLFFGTIRSNMLVGKPDATDGEIWKALDMAQATEFVRAMDKGLDSTVEKAGGNFSGGQKQRLCIARALLKDADVYVFDDSFSALDFKTDAAVRLSMKEKVKNAVTVIVAQRVCTVQNADQIAVLDGGALAGLGTHEELMADNPVYQQVVDSQTYKEAA